MPTRVIIAVIFIGPAMGTFAKPLCLRQDSNVLISAPPGAITTLSVTPSGTAIVYASLAGLFHCDLKAKQPKQIASQLDHIHCSAFSPDGKVLAIGGGTPAEAGVVELWSWPDIKLLGQLHDHKDLIYDLVWINDHQLATGSADRTVKLWDISKKQVIQALTGHSGPVLSLAVTPDGRWLCSGSADHTIRVWKTDSRELVRSLTNHLGPVQGLAFRPLAKDDDRPPYLASAGLDGTVRIWQPTIGRMVRIIRHPAPVYAVAWSKEGDKVYSGAKDGTLRVIDAESDQVLAQRAIGNHRLLSITVPLRNSFLLAGDSASHVYQIHGMEDDS